MDTLTCPIPDRRLASLPGPDTERRRHEQPIKPQTAEEAEFLEAYRELDEAGRAWLRWVTLTELGRRPGLDEASSEMEEPHRETGSRARGRRGGPPLSCAAVRPRRGPCLGRATVVHRMSR